MNRGGAIVAAELCVARPWVAPNLQIARLEASGCDRVFVDVGYSSRLEDRPDWNRAREATNRPGDELVIPARDRVAGTETIAINVIQSFASNSVRILNLDEPWMDIDTSTAMGEAMLRILATLAELRVSMIRENTRRGVEFARSQGRVGGRPTVMTEERIAAARKMRQEDMSFAQIDRALGVLFELAVVHDDATTAELLKANNVCIGALALAWEVHAGFRPDATCWLIRVQSVEETGGDAEYLSLFVNADDAAIAAADERFAVLAEASGATPNALSDLLDGTE